jgi:hypothetical protein
MVKCQKNKEPHKGGALKPKFLKPKTEIPKQVRDDIYGDSTFIVMLNSFQHLMVILKIT